ncbi:GntR family transcriptional regulator [Anaerocolumna chitinilytica]|uniref:Phosphonate metabolism transcriptional regulator PhnF n=1 Tax=Anaerocolumna chitinilytica TaxID=1727145 RepID=A0A7M3SB85_9FIRM|nr:GntR family transcriptional regulator [Anaerocolumna chitinilytica]BCK01853.1 phosphonate metabolism transcriptional regulator PhnF [Anaerocolumna chitinilytica]
MTLDRGKAAVALYLQISQQIAEAIEHGEYTTGQIIPSEKQLQEQYGVSRMTVRLAVGELANKGYVERMRGIGTVVTYGKIEENLKRVISFSEEMQLHGIQMQTSYCEIKLVNATEKVAGNLGISVNSAVYELTRVRCANNKPLVYSVTYLKMQNLPLDAGLYSDSLYKVLKEKYNINITRAGDQLEATLAEGAVAKYLEVAQGFPTFKRTRVAYDQQDNEVEYSICYYPGDKYRYSVNL